MVDFACISLFYLHIYLIKKKIHIHTRPLFLSHTHTYTRIHAYIGSLFFSSEKCLNLPLVFPNQIKHLRTQSCAYPVPTAPFYRGLQFQNTFILHFLLFLFQIMTYIPTRDRLYEQLKLNKKLTDPEVRAIMHATFVDKMSPLDIKNEWHLLRLPLVNYLRVLRTNLDSEIKNVYYQTLVDADLQIRSRTNESVRPPHAHWQEFVSREERYEWYERFDVHYADHQGKRIIPFAPPAFMREHKARLARTKKAIETERLLWYPEYIASRSYAKPQLTADIRTAIVLAACKQAEIALYQYERALKTGAAHPYENPVKVNWLHYLQPELRTRLRAALAGEYVSSEGLEGFLK